MFKGNNSDSIRQNRSTLKYAMFFLLVHCFSINASQQDDPECTLAQISMSFEDGTVSVSTTELFEISNQEEANQFANCMHSASQGSSVSTLNLGSRGRPGKLIFNLAQPLKKTSEEKNVLEAKDIFLKFLGNDSASKKSFSRFSKNISNDENAYKADDLVFGDYTNNIYWNFYRLIKIARELKETELTEEDKAAEGLEKLIDVLDTYDFDLVEVKKIDEALLHIKDLHGTLVNYKEFDLNAHFALVNADHIESFKSFIIGITQKVDELRRRFEAAKEDQGNGKSALRLESFFDLDERSEAFMKSIFSGIDRFDLENSFDEALIENRNLEKDFQKIFEGDMRRMTVFFREMDPNLISNQSIKSIPAALNNIKEILNGDVEIRGMSNAYRSKRVKWFPFLEKIEGDLIIRNNHSDEFRGLNNLRSVRRFLYSQNSQMTSFNAFNPNMNLFYEQSKDVSPGLRFSASKIRIENNQRLKSLKGLHVTLKPKKWEGSISKHTPLNLLQVLGNPQLDECYLEKSLYEWALFYPNRVMVAENAQKKPGDGRFCSSVDQFIEDSIESSSKPIMVEKDGVWCVEANISIRHPSILHPNPAKREDAYVYVALAMHRHRGGRDQLAIDHLDPSTQCVAETTECLDLNENQWRIWPGDESFSMFDWNGSRVRDFEFVIQLRSQAGDLVHEFQNSSKIITLPKK